MKQRATNHTAEILSVLGDAPSMLGALALAAGVVPSAALKRLRRLAQLRHVDCSRVWPAAEMAKPRRDRSETTARVMWRLHGTEKPAALPADAPLPAREPRRVPPRARAHTNDRPEPIEILARMAGRTNFLTPKKTSASNAVPVTALDIAHAISYAGKDVVDARGRTIQRGEQLGATMALAMACQRPMDWPKVQELARDRLINLLKRQNTHRDIVDGANAYRARIVLYDAFGDLIAPALRRNLREAARSARMRREPYRHLLKHARALLEGAANTAAARAVRYLFALAVVEHPLVGAVRAVSVGVSGEIVLWPRPAREVNAHMPSADAIDVGELCREIVAAQGRERLPGVLSLRATSAHIVR